MAGCIDPVPGTDGLIHLAYVVQLTNHTANPMTIQSFEVVDPDNKNMVTGHNKVVSILNENITPLVQPFILPPTLDLGTTHRSFLVVKRVKSILMSLIPTLRVFPPISLTA